MEKIIRRDVMKDRKYLVIGLVTILMLGLGCVDNTSPKSGTDEEKKIISEPR